MYMFTVNFEDYSELSFFGLETDLDTFQLRSQLFLKHLHSFIAPPLCPQFWFLLLLGDQITKTPP